MEYEPGGVADLTELLERSCRARARKAATTPTTGSTTTTTPTRTRVRPSSGPSESIPLVDGRLVLGTWQQVVLIDFDDRPRDRVVHVQIAS